MSDAITYPQPYLDFVATLPYAPSAEQVAAVDACLSSKDNLLISALAGAAKTSTLKLIAHALHDVNIISLAFNKAIATEMSAELPSNCKCMTLNSLGHRVWGQYLGRRLFLQKGKMYDLLVEYSDKRLSPGEQREISEDFSYILQACAHAKSAGHLPDHFMEKLPPRHKAKRLMCDEELIDSLDENVSPLVRDTIIHLLNQSAIHALDGLIDFGDQVLFPSLFKCTYPIHTLILIDEAQDLSALNHMMLQQLYRRRIIAVGDQNQAIYAFRGAYESGMEEMKKRFKMNELHLTTTFRCPEPIVKHVHWRTPDMKSFGDKPGEVKTLNAWSAADLPETCSVLCRNNAPLLSIGVSLLRAGRYPNIWGNDIAKGLIKILKDLGPKNLDQASAKSLLLEWKEKRLRKVKRKGLVHDQYSCLLVFIEAEPTLGESIDHADFIFRCTGQVDLLTCHKSKGHEFDEVFILDEDLMGDEGQELNLRYVACTRSKRNLTYIKTENFMGDE